jgi:DNA-binding transcriptional regulator YdaS (Cro superfamily)
MLPMELSDYIGKFPGRSKSKFRKQLALQLGVTAEAIRYWEIGIRKPRVEYVLQLEEITKGMVTRFDLRPDMYASKNKKKTKTFLANPEKA